MPKLGKLREGWKVVFRYLREYRRDVLVISVLGVISALANGFVPFIVGRLFDAILDTSRTFMLYGAEAPLWVWLLSVLGVVQIVANLVDWRNDVRSRRVGTFLSAEYPARATERLIHLPLSFHKDQKTGEVWDKIRRGINAIHAIIGRVLLSVAPEVLSVIVGLVVAFFIQPVLAGIIVIGVLLYIGTLMKILPPIVKLQERSQRAYSRAFGSAHSAVSNVHTVKFSTAEDYEGKSIRKMFIDKAANAWYRIEKIWSAIGSYQRFIVTLTQITVFAVSVYFITEGSLTLGGLIALNGYAGMVFGPFVRLGYDWQTMQEGLVALGRAEKMLSTPTEVYSPKNAVDIHDMRGDVELKNVHFTYKKNDPKVLNGVSLKIKAGEVVALVGESGVGKSTLVDLISGYYFAQRGKVLIDGYDIKQIKLRELRDSIAVVPQEVTLFNETIKNNIRYGAFKASDDEIKKAAKDAHADVFIEKFPKKYNQLVGERGIKLSVGQKQRVAIARAILRDPKILILDEPTSALDAQTEKYISESLEKLMKGRTTIIIAHRLSTARRADRIYVFDKGKVVEEGKHEGLMKIKNGVYQRLYKLHIGLL